MYTQTPQGMSSFCDRQYLPPFSHLYSLMLPTSPQQAVSRYGYCGVSRELLHLSGISLDNAMQAHVGLHHASFRKTPAPSQEWVNRLAFRNAAESALQKAPQPAGSKVERRKRRRKSNMIEERGTN
jgi:hypothetical protein